MKTESDYIDFCLAQLTAAGIQAYVTGGQGGTLRVPAFEGQDNKLDLKAIHDFIDHKLGGQPLKGLVINEPLSGEFKDLYCYDPMTTVQGKIPGVDDVVMWCPPTTLDAFAWTELTDGFDLDWDDGWETDAGEGVPRRIAFLASLLSAEVIDLPPVAPLTIPELVTRLQARKDGSGIVCYHGGHMHLELRLNDEAKLVIWSEEKGEMARIDETNIDSHGCVIFNSVKVLHRSDLY